MVLLVGLALNGNVVHSIYYSSVHQDVRVFFPDFPSEVAFALERVPSALGVGMRWFRLAQKIAQVKKMLLGGAAFGQVGFLPRGNEFLRSHR